MSHLPVSRRQLLGGGLALAATAVAGCTRTDPDAGSASTALRLRLVPEEPTLREQYVVDLAEAAPEWSSTAFEAALAGEAYTTQYRRPFPSTPADPRYARRDGTYYRLGAVVVDEAEAVRPVLRLHREESSGDDEPTPVSEARLPTSDQRAIRVAWMAARARGNSGGVPGGLVQRGGYVYRDPAAIERSELLGPDRPARLTYKGATYTVEVAEETFYEPVYRATVEPVAEDPGRMEAILRATFVDARIPGDELSETATEVLESARHDEYEESHPYSDGYREVIERLHRRPYLDGDIDKDAGVENDQTRLLLYDGEYFDYVLRFLSVA